MKLELFHIDTCTPDYWLGHSTAHVQIPVYPGMTLKEIKESLRSEINRGAVAGSDELSFLLGDNIFCAEQERESEKAYRAAYAAINRMKPTNKNQRKFFTKLEQQDDEDLQVYAYFILGEC